MNGVPAMPESSARYLVAPSVVPPLDPDFRPAVLARRALQAAVEGSGAAVPVALAVEQPGGAVCARDTAVFADGHPHAPEGHAVVERLLKTMLWSRGGTRIWVDGPASLVASLRAHYADDPTGRFDSEVVGRAAFGADLEVVHASRESFPLDRPAASTVGGHLEGCRIGFDLGASDRKVAAVRDGEVVFSEEVGWDPARHDDPQWHYEQIMDSLVRAAAHLPRVDAIGGSTAGIVVDNAIRVASLFRAVPPELFDRRVRGLFNELARAWGGIPFVVVNDGEVTALAGAMSAGVGGLLGVAMGSSEAAGYVSRARGLTSWLNELAFAPIDYRPDAPRDEWSGDRGCGAQYLSQQAVGRLLPVAGIRTDPASSLPDRLVLLQRRMADGDERAARVYETIGAYLGYALLEYRDWYDFEHVLLLGRVTTGPGGDLIASRARDVLRAEGVNGDRWLTFHAVSERDKRHGQAVAAASLPTIAPRRSADAHAEGVWGAAAAPEPAQRRTDTTPVDASVDGTPDHTPHGVRPPGQPGQPGQPDWSAGPRMEASAS
jgi:predicted NBD/HSP70 family sugar kinase